MYKGRSKVLPIALIVIVTIVAIIALVSVGRAILGRTNSNTNVEAPTESTLLVAEADRSVRMIVRGPIVADEEFNTYQIEIGPSSRRMTTHKGYQDAVIDSRQLTNSMNAYEEFIHALEKANFSQTVNLNDEGDDTRGICAAGRLYTFETLQAGSVSDSSWITSCSNKAGSFKGSGTRVRDLFLEQIPDSSTLLRGLNL